jgi:hypothetical protein
MGVWKKTHGRPHFEQNYCAINILTANNIYFHPITVWFNFLNWNYIQKRSWFAKILDLQTYSGCCYDRFKLEVKEEMFFKDILGEINSLLLWLCSKNNVNYVPRLRFDLDYLWITTNQTKWQLLNRHIVWPHEEFVKLYGKAIYYSLVIWRFRNIWLLTYSRKCVKYFFISEATIYSAFRVIVLDS